MTEYAMLDIVVRRLHAEAGKLDSVTTGFLTRYIAQHAASRLVAARFVVFAVVDAFGATVYFAALHYIAVYLRSSFCRINVLLSGAGDRDTERDDGRLGSTRRVGPEADSESDRPVEQTYGAGDSAVGG
jgi:hypothetical protein